MQVTNLSSTRILSLKIFLIFLFLFLNLENLTLSLLFLIKLTLYEIAHSLFISFDLFVCFFFLLRESDGWCYPSDESTLQPLCVANFEVYVYPFDFS